MMEGIPYITTDDRKIEPAGGSCGHRKCNTLGFNCRMFSEATLEITPADEAKAKELVAEGWWSTSGKRRTIRRWKERVPSPEELIRPEQLNTFHGQRLAHFLRGILKHNDWVSYDAVTRKPWPDDLFVDAQLSPSLYRAFKAAGGECGR